MIVISTAGSGADTPLARLRTRALASPIVRRTGSVTDTQSESLRMLEWALPEDGDADDAHAVKRANPASWITVDGLAEQREAVPDMAYRRFHGCQWGSGEGAWIPPGAWQACAGDATIALGERVWVGLDAGGERSATAIAWRTFAHRLQVLPWRRRHP